jgi:hypothetical protein
VFRRFHIFKTECFIPEAQSGKSVETDDSVIAVKRGTFCAK